MKRHSMSRRASKRGFTHAAMLTHRKNISPAPMRGGIRL